MASSKSPQLKELEKTIRDIFKFLEDDQNLAFGGLRRTGPKSSSHVEVAVRYEGSFGRLDIGWDESEGALGVLLCYSDNALDRDDRYANFEPFVEYLTNGETKQIIPHVRNGMRTADLENVILTRGKVLEEGFESLLQRMADKLKEHFPSLKSASPEQILDFHKWWENPGR